MFEREGCGCIIKGNGAVELVEIGGRVFVFDGDGVFVEPFM